MSYIDLTIQQEQLEATAKHCRERGITLPTFKMMRDPEQYVPDSIKAGLKDVDRDELNPLNLYRITWRNEQKRMGGLYGDVNHIVLPPELTGCKATIVALCGKFFPTGAHKVGASFACLAPRLVTGQFNPENTKAVWPSTGNYCRGGAYISNLMACHSIAILPEDMSRERFEWLEKVADETIATPGCESNVKEIFDKCWELRNSGQDLMIFNQFDELGNPTWHYNVTGPTAEAAIQPLLAKGMQLAGYVSSSGSGGTLGGGYYLKDKFPKSKLIVSEALQCPTILMNGFGDHRIEGIGDKHIPWVHDCRNMDSGVAVDDEQPVRLLRLFNEPKGRELLKQQGIDPELIEKLDLLGISGIANVIASIKYAKHQELTENDVLVTIATDSLEMYGSRLTEMTAERGEYTEFQAHRDAELLANLDMLHVKEMGYWDRKAVHNLKYYTWIEQQGRDVKELNAQWTDKEAYWQDTFAMADQMDDLIEQFNDMVGLKR
ncbi:pyridoxal-phosphate dependent enzyme [Sansalvadorimonas sp. 2012CJ34-2]|uniref:cysteine synthase n=1 Tax=Parendozoicomonas callyspongiae TaxID=2942213 RepID=A0ABT0PI08_9GAMM|nr:pyridoxal-phosphate dependent enzyme [Sansalvadorimonas sp. 2012CJ34-2]MCL6270970.1 pyridoxal-phosphate dependent enzyme [Sansalvadorimonas sp. 2012CJ34-2]